MINVLKRYCTFSDGEIGQPLEVERLVFGDKPIKDGFFIEVRHEITLISPGEGDELRGPFTFFHGKSPHFAVYFILKDTKTTLSQILEHYAYIPFL